MNKEDVQERVTQNGKKLPFSKFIWDPDTRTFSSHKDKLVINFAGIGDCNFITGDFCNFITEERCSFKTGYFCVFDTEDNCTFNTGGNCTFDTGHGCAFNTGEYCVFNTSDVCTFDTRDDCIIVAGRNCTFDTGNDCTFNTGGNCTFKTHDACVFDVGFNCVIKACINSFIVFRKNDKVESLVTEPGTTYQTTTLFDNHTILIDNISVKDGKKYIIVNGILFQVLNQKGNVYKIINNDKTEISETSYIIEQDGIYFYGKTLKDAREAIFFR